jgi:antitoxin component of RelBE/YafQ-DinJ toxin-antitoxin module
MRKVNLDEPKITLRLDLKLKKKAATLAKKRGMSISQFVEMLISQTDGESGLGAEQVRAIVREEMTSAHLGQDKTKGKYQTARERSRASALKNPAVISVGGSSTPGQENSLQVG